MFFLETWRVIDHWLNTLRPRSNGCHFPDDIFKCTFLNENVWISIKIPLKFVPIHGSIQQYSSIGLDSGLAPARRQAIIGTNDGYLLTHIRVTRPQWVKQTMAYLWRRLYRNYITYIQCLKVCHAQVLWKLSRKTSRSLSLPNLRIIWQTWRSSGQPCGLW